MRVNLSFGLHAGWAIEGAVGSEFKIDASYVSPNAGRQESILLVKRLRRYRNRLDLSREVHWIHGMPCILNFYVSFQQGVKVFMV